MKHLMVILVGLMCALGASAQSALIATLMHGDEISTFQSSEALKQAYKKAVDGDVITLSSGTFNAPGDITKAITIRGAGMMAGSTNPTIIANYFRIATTGTITIEGLNCADGANAQGQNIRFNKVKFSSTFLISDKQVGNISMFHCILNKFCPLSEIRTFTVSFVNSFVNFSYRTDSGGTYSYANMTQLRGASFDNCIISYDFSINSNVDWGTLKNSVVYSDRAQTLSALSTASGCVHVGPGTFFAKCAPELNKQYPTGTPIFKEGTLTYELTEENQKNWIGTDGTQVGMHGGNLPFDSAVAAPVISKFNVASKTTADGKLSVDIEVKAAE